MIRCRPRLPLVGDQVHALMGRGNAKTKTFLRREHQDQAGGSARLPLVGPERSQNHQKGDPTPAHLYAGFQAHPSMRICCPKPCEFLGARSVFLHMHVDLLSVRAGP
jgi:hypothetical protein